MSCAEFSARCAPPEGMREFLASSLMQLVLRGTLKPALSPRIPFAWQRRSVNAVSRIARPARSVEIRPGMLGGVGGEWLHGRDADGRAKGSAAILYFHGGGYCVGSAASHRAVTSRLARATGLAVFAAEYRLAPEHPFPAAVEDAVAAYSAMRKSGPVVAAGDSAGAGLCVATAFAVRQRGLGNPAAMVLFSPWLDLTLAAIPETAGDALLRRGWLASCARLYLDGHDATAPAASPLYGDLRGLPPTLIQAGGDEILVADATRMHDALCEAGVTSRCEIVARRWHGFQLHAGILPSANEAIERAAEFVLGVLGS